MILKKDNFKLGLILGVLGPILGLVVVYFIKFPGLEFGEFLDLFFNTNRLITSVGSLSLMARATSFEVLIKNFQKQNSYSINEGDHKNSFGSFIPVGIDIDSKQNNIG